MSIIDALLKLAPAALQYGGYRLKQRANEDARNERNRVIATMQGINTGATRDMVNTTRGAVQQYTPQQRMPNLAEQEQAAIRRLVQDVSVSPQAVSSGPMYSGRTTERYDATAAQRAADELRYATRLAHIMGRAAAPAELSLREGFSNTNAALDRARTRSNARGNLNVQGVALNEAEPSPARMIGGDLMQTAGLYMGAQQAARKNQQIWGAP